MVMVAPTSENMAPFMQKFFIPITCFLLFNVCDFLGSCVPAWVKWPSAKYTWILTTARILFYPIFLFSNYRPATRHLPVFLNDWAYIVVVIAMGLSNGYLKTIVMMDGPQAVRNPNWAGKASLNDGPLPSIGHLLWYSVLIGFPTIVTDW
ncbi:equilibrative nucleoside transporter 3-like [Amphiura filiformis]|uniref:equilibrative nucleoside transporter 3-like n=1 Tax=Amphiura filiformis TaxID=82378 RepID=UPI003B20BBA7